MYINFNIEKLDKLLLDFYNITGLTISVWTADFHQLSYQPQEMRAFCRTIRSTEKGKRGCALSDLKVCTECSKTGKISKHICHAGLIDMAFPIKYKDNILGYIMFGQISCKSEMDILPIIEKVGSSLGVDTNALKEQYGDLIKYDEAMIDSAANILKLATRYLWLSDYIEIHDSTASEIHNYIRNHLNENISVDSLCKALYISKKRLYAVSHRNFGVPVGEYINTLRINEAKHLLETTDLSIRQIAGKVGIQDYNYFTKIFKHHVGISPSKYRKGFPFILHNT